MNYCCDNLKALAFILSAYVVMLLATPCCVFEDCSGETIKTELTGHLPNTNEEDCGSCSPFFNCGDCANFVFTVESVDFSMVAFIPASTYIEYTDTFIPDVHTEFWQPPRV